MPTATTYGETPWTTAELAALYGISGSRARERQEQLDTLIVETLAPAYVAKGTRADQAAASIAALAPTSRPRANVIQVREPSDAIRNMIAPATLADVAARGEQIVALADQALARCVGSLLATVAGVEAAEHAAISALQTAGE